MSSLELLEMLESEHHLVTALSMEARSVANDPEAYQGMEGGLGIGNGIPWSEAYNLPLNAKSVMESVMAIFCGSIYPMHMSVVEVYKKKVLTDRAFTGGLERYLGKWALESWEGEF